jgi:predicted amidohydrolase YtcJ
MVAGWAVVAAFGQQASGVADEIFYNGKIVTVDPSFGVHEAFAVQGEKFLAVGGNAEVEALAGPSTRRTDLRGHTVIPGLMDNHNHQYHAGLVFLRGADLRGVPSLAELLSRIRQQAPTAPPGQVLYGSMGWNPNDFPERRPPTRQDLDEAAPNHPVVVYQARGLARLNTAALRLAGFSRDRPTVGRATALQDASGELTGALSGSPSAILNPTTDISPLTLDEIKGQILEIQQRQHAVGLTSIRDLQIRPDAMRAYFDLWREGRLTLRVSMGLELNPEDVDQLQERLRHWGVGSGFGDHWLRLDGIAEFNPGNNNFREPPLAPGDDDGSEMRLPVEKYRQAILLMNRLGWRPSPHINADGGLDQVLDAYEAADRERSIREKRWIVEHVPLMHPDQIERMKRLGVMVSAQIHPYRGAGNMVRQLGRERAERAVPIREMLDHGLIVSTGSDWPGAIHNPFLNIYFYVTRDTLPLGPFGTAQRISRAEALRVSTINNAYLTFEEQIKGSIEVGKLADFLILSADILTVPESQIPSIRPLATYVGGRKVFARDGGGF